jgi:hypothetical protein
MEQCEAVTKIDRAVALNLRAWRLDRIHPPRPDEIRNYKEPQQVKFESFAWDLEMRQRIGVIYLKDSESNDEDCFHAQNERAAISLSCRTPSRKNRLVYVV